MDTLYRSLVFCIHRHRILTKAHRAADIRNRDRILAEQCLTLHRATDDLPLPTLASRAAIHPPSFPIHVDCSA